VIIGPDLVYRHGEIQPDANGRARSDKSIKGLKSLMKRDPVAAKEMASRIIKNTYRTLMTRGMRGCFVYCTDHLLAEYLRSRLRGMVAPQVVEQADSIVSAKATASNVIPLRIVTATERAVGKNAAPLIELRFAAGSFSEAQSLEEGAQEWVELPDWIPYQPGFFVAQVVGESMNKRIPNGAWCLFRAAPGGTRNGKIVVVQHRSIDDPETGGSYTIKRYSSEKVMEPDGTWRHTRVELWPETDNPGFEAIVLEVGEDEEFSVVAEMLTVLQ
jgi:hypothetical protein